MAYVATVNIPGYLPMDDQPPIFETAREAWECLVEERNQSWNQTDDMGPDFDPVMDKMDKWAKSDLVCDFEKVGTIYGETPGYDGDHDLGLAYCVTEIEVYGACGVKDCLDCRPLFDADNNAIPGTEF